MSKRTYSTAFGQTPAFPAATSLTSTRWSESEILGVSKQVCYGALCEAFALSLGNKLFDELLTKRSVSTAKLTAFPLRKTDSYYTLQSDYGIELGLLDSQSTAKLTTVDSLSSVRFEAVVNQEAVSKLIRGSQHRSRSLSISINIYGLASISEDVGRKLSEGSAFLQHPKLVSSGVEYYNPQFFDIPEDSTNMEELINLADTSRQQKMVDLSHEVSRIMDSLEVVAAQEEWCPPPGLKTSLQKYQVGGMAFILQREDDTFSQQLEDKLLPVSEGRYESASRCYGGVVADVMGLGKTLTMLAAILHSLPSAESFGLFSCNSRNETSAHKLTKATLIVVPSSQLLESWYSQIQRHISPDTLETIKFHGSSRERDPKLIMSADLVLTTYATLASECKAEDSLHQFKWYRIVLDEAHWIRNSASKKFQAVSRLEARARWCLTGTPIQNSLNDLASLAEFLRLPFCASKATFQKLILSPLSRGGSNYTKPLQAYLQAYCIRRTEKYLDLPPLANEVVSLSPSTEEQNLYDELLNQTRTQIDNAVSNNKTIQKYNVLFTAILRMRMLCNNGASQSLTSVTNFVGKNLQNVWCEKCSSIDGETQILFTSCEHCPDCGRLLTSHYENSQATVGIPESPRDPSQFRPPIGLSPSQGGLSTKLCAIVENILRCTNHNDKSIIFSSWITTLDLLATLFKSADIPYVQIDGRTSYKERSNRLQAFESDTHCSTLLMSIETGAEGLNLTVANRVHIIEPQWNPSVEEQCIGRALRLGQTREVTVFRYIMKDTIEQNILKLQQRKKDLARFAMNFHDDTNYTYKLEDLEAIIDLAP